MESIGHHFAAGFVLLGAAAILAVGAMTTNQEMAAAAVTPDAVAAQTISTQTSGGVADRHLLYAR